MPLYNVLSKGEYTHSQPATAVTVKQYIIVRSEGKRRLLLRFRNTRPEALSSISFELLQYDIKGRFIRTERIDLAASAEGGEEFAPERYFELADSCEDFKVKMLSASYGSYAYKPRGAAEQVVYEKHAAGAKIDRTPFYSKMREKKHRVTARSMHSPITFIPLVLIIILATLATVLLRLSHFTAMNNEFTLGGIGYSFATEDRENGPVYVTSYEGEGETLIIPKSVEGHEVIAILPKALSGASVTNVIIEGSPRINSYAFFDNKTLKSISLVGVTGIDNDAFSGCSALETVTLGEGLTRIDTGAFYGCSSLSEITLPETLLYVGSSAFENCSSLRSLTLPDGIETLGESLVKGASSLESLKLAKIALSSEQYTDLSKLLGPADTRKNLSSLTLTQQTELGERVFAGEKYLKSIVISKPLTAVGESCFEGCSSLSSFNLPATVTKVGKAAFLGCSSLASVTFEPSISAMPESLFKDCSSLKEITLPDSLSAIGASAFENCSSLSTLEIPRSVTALGTGMLKGCTSLEQLYLYNLPSDLTVRSLYANSPVEGLKLVSISSAEIIAEGCFEGFEGLRSVYLSAGVKQLSARAFLGCSSLEALTVPETVSLIGENVFTGCASLDNVKIPSGVKIIPKSAFMGCSSLTELKLPADLREIGEGAFSDCTSLGAFDMPDSVTVLGKGAFRGCTSLSLMLISDSVEVLPDEFLRGCTSLQTVTLPDGLTSLGEYVLADCTGLVELTVPGNVTEISKGVLMGCTALGKLTVPEASTSVSSHFGSYFADENLNWPVMVAKEIPASLKSVCVYSDANLSSGAFSFASNIEKIDLLVSAVKVIKSNTFSNCTSLKEITPPMSLEKIESGAFVGCTSLKSLTAPDGLTSIEKEAFLDCISLETVSLNGNLQTIGNDAFKNCMSLTEIFVPASVSSIGEGALSGCISLEELSVPFVGTGASGDTVHKLFGDSVPTSLKSVTVRGSSELAKLAFEGCSSIETVSLADSIEVIGEGAFLGCSSLKSVELPSALTNVEAEAFAGCTSLSSLDLPSSVIYVGAAALSGCSSIESVTLPFVGTTDGVGSLNALFGNTASSVPASLSKVTVLGGTAIADRAFSGLDKIKEVVLSSNTLIEIGERAFYGCASLRKITLPASLETVGEGAFLDCVRLRTLVNKSDLSVGTDLASTGISNFLLTTVSDEASLVTKTVGGFEMLLANSGVWYAVDYDIAATTKALVTPSPFTVGEATVTSYEIAPYFAMGDTEITSLRITSAVKKIGSYAFASCSALTALTADTDAALTEIGVSAFASCRSLEVATVPADTLYISDGAFSNCKHLIVVFNHSTLSIVAGATTFGGVAYDAEVVLTSEQKTPEDINIDGLNFRKIGPVFILKSLKNNLSTLDFGALRYGGEPLMTVVIDDNSLKNSTLSSVKISSNVISVGDYAFIGSNNLTEVTFEEGVKKFGSSCFARCSKLASVTLPASLTHLGGYDFYSCASLSSVTLSGGITEIPVYAFAECPSLRSFTVPENISFIGANAFSGCNKLIEVINLSDDLYLSPGASSSGGIAKFAIKVRTSLSDTPFSFETVENGQLRAEFAKDSSGAYMFELEVKNNASLITMPTLTLSGGSIEYAIHSTVEGLGVTSIVMPKNTVSSISEALYGSLSDTTLYFTGNETELAGIVDGDVFLDVLYYSECIHEAGLWRYGDDGEISTAFTETTVTELTAAGCDTPGEDEHYCEVCRESWTVATDPLGHSYENGACTECGAPEPAE